MNLKAREKTTQIRQTLDAIGVDLAHSVAEGDVDVTDASWVTVSVHDAEGKVMISFQTQLLPNSTTVMSMVGRVPDLLGRSR